MRDFCKEDKLPREVVKKKAKKALIKNVFVYIGEMKKKKDLG